MIIQVYALRELHQNLVYANRINIKLINYSSFMQYYKHE